MDTSRRQALAGALGIASSCAIGSHLDARPTPGPHPGAEWGSGVNGERIADLGNDRFRNPIMAGDHPDPSILRDGDTYFQVSSSFVYYPGLVIWRSADLVNWTPIGPALQEPIGSVYAPDLVKHEGRYYIYFAVRSLPGQLARNGSPARPMINYVVHSESIEGPWSDPVDIGIYNAIDPGHAVGEDGKRYLYVSDGNLIPLSDDGLSRAGPDEKLYEGWRYPADWAVETFALEGPKILRKGEWFYLFSAQGGTAGPPTSHMVIVARSKSIRGPWVNCPHNPIVRTRSAAEPWWSRGHGTPVEDASGQWWMIYHGYENGYRSLGRQTLLEPLAWSAEGWPRSMGGTLAEPLRKPAQRKVSAQHSREPGQVRLRAEQADPFAQSAFGAGLALFKPDRGYRDRVRFEAGSVVVEGQGAGPANASPLVLNAGDRSYELTVHVDLEGAATAGLLLFYNEKLFCGIASDPNRFRAYSLGGENAFEARTASIGRRFHLRLINRDQVGQFYYSLDGVSWTLHRSYEVSGYNHNIAGGYLSLRPGLFVAGGGRATFSTARYRGLPASN